MNEYPLDFICEWVLRKDAKLHLNHNRVTNKNKLGILLRNKTLFSRDSVGDWYENTNVKYQSTLTSL